MKVVGSKECVVKMIFDQFISLKNIYQTQNSKVIKKLILTISFVDADRDKLAESNGKFAQYLNKILDVYFSYHHDAYSTKGWFSELELEQRQDIVKMSADFSWDL